MTTEKAFRITPVSAMQTRQRNSLQRSHADYKKKAITVM